MLPGHIPECEFGNNPNHRKKALTRELLALAKALLNKKATMTKMDATQIGKKIGYMIQSLLQTPKNKSIHRWHHFDIQKHCGVWCSQKIQLKVD